MLHLLIEPKILNETRDKFLVTKKSNGVWDLPGGGLEWGEKPHEGLSREIKEEMNLEITWIAERPAYFLGGYPMLPEQDIWLVNVVYETQVAHLEYTVSDECVEVRFISVTDVAELDQVPSPVRDLAQQFRSEYHIDIER